jgi:hypothetical protein
MAPLRILNESEIIDHFWNNQSSLIAELTVSKFLDNHKLIFLKEVFISTFKRRRVK